MIDLLLVVFFAFSTFVTLCVLATYFVAFTEGYEGYNYKKTRLSKYTGFFYVYKLGRYLGETDDN